MVYPKIYCILKPPPPSPFLSLSLEHIHSKKDPHVKTIGSCAITSFDKYMDLVLLQMDFSSSEISEICVIVFNLLF